MQLFNQDLLQQLFTGISLIIVFISLKASPIGNYIDNHWGWFLAGGIFLFAYASSLSKKMVEVI